MGAPLGPWGSSQGGCPGPNYYINFLPDDPWRMSKIDVDFGGRLGLILGWSWPSLGWPFGPWSGFWST